MDTICDRLTRALRVALIAAGLAASLPVWAQVTLNARGTFDGQYREGSYAGVELEVSSRANTKGTIEAWFPAGRSKTRFTQPIELPEGAHKRLTIYVRPSEYQSEVELRFVPHRGRVLTNRATLSHNTLNSLLVFVIHDQLSGYHFIRSIDTSKWPSPSGLPPTVSPRGPSTPSTSGEPIVVAYSDSEHMPDQWKGYDSANLVVLDEFSPSALSTEQKEALSEWVRMGGCLLVVGGENFERLRDSFLSELLPVDVIASRAVEGLSALENEYGSPMPSGTPVLTVCRTREGAETILGQDGLPLIVRGPHGMGNVYFVAFSIDRQPVKDWPGLQRLVSDIIREVRDVVPRICTGINESDVSRGITENPSMTIPSFKLVGLFLVSYLLCLVPVNYFVLKRLNKRELAWITTPAIVVVFTFIAYGIGVVMRGGQIVIYSASVIEARSGSPLGLGTTYFSVFSPRKAEYSISFSQPHVAVGRPRWQEYPWGNPEEAEASHTELAYDGADRIASVRINMWDQELFSARAAAALDGAVTASLRLIDSQLVGKVHNGTPFDVHHAALYYQGEVTPLGSLAPGGTTEVRQEVSMAPPPVSIPQPEPYPGSKSPHASPWPGTGTVQGRDVFNQLQYRTNMLSDANLDSDAARIRQALLNAVFAQGRPVFSKDEAILIAWVDKEALEVDIAGKRPKKAGQVLLIVHLKVAALRSS